MDALLHVGSVGNRRIRPSQASPADCPLKWWGSDGLTDSGLAGLARLINYRYMRGTSRRGTKGRSIRVREVSISNAEKGASTHVIRDN